jgi:hypothetical protein
MSMGDVFKFYGNVAKAVIPKSDPNAPLKERTVDEGADSSH